MDFLIKKPMAIHVLFALSEILDVVIGIIINVVTNREFNALSTPSIVMWCVLFFFVAAHIGCGILVHNATQGAKNKQFAKAFKKHGGYDVLAEEAKNCVKNQDYQSLKKVVEMANLVER